MVSMNHLSKEEVNQIMGLVRNVIETDDYNPDKMDEIFKISKVAG